jgi:hypothetical protein
MIPFGKDSGDLVWLLVDDCHCEDCNEAIIKTWLPGMVPGGIVAFHHCDDAYRFKKIEAHGSLHSMHGLYRSVVRSKIIRDEFTLIHKSPAIHWRRGKLFGGMRAYQKNA